MHGDALANLFWGGRHACCWAPSALYTLFTLLKGAALAGGIPVAYISLCATPPVLALYLLCLSV